MKDIEFHKRLIGAIKNLEAYTDNLTIDTSQADRLMQEVARHCNHSALAEHSPTHENRLKGTTTEGHSQQTDIAHLPDYLQEVFVLYISGYKLHEIADILHIPAGTVKSRIYAAEMELEKS